MLGQFIEEGALVNVFPESQNDTDELGSCILVTSKHVVFIKQRYVWLHAHMHACISMNTHAHYNINNV